MRITTTAIKCVQNGKAFYLALLNKSTLAKTCFVSRRENNQEDGFQRNLNEARAKDIAKYFDEKNGVIPSALILSAQREANFCYQNDQIEFDDEKMSFMVLDGQHRLYGLLKTARDYSMPVAIFNDLTVENEVNLFIDINTNQKGVPATLLLDIKKLTGKETTLEQKQRYLFDELNKDGVMAGMFSASTSKVGKITRVSFNKSTRDIIENSVLSNMPENKILTGIKNFLEAGSVIFQRSRSQKAKLNNSMLFRALFAIANDVIERALEKKGNVKVDTLVEIMEPLAKITYDNYVGSSEATYSKILSDMKMEIKKDKFLLSSDEIF